jgi:glycosyltransferase involved in cell wall biosynthesis
MSSSALSLVLPCFNEEENIAITAREVLQWMHSTGKTGELIIVNDGSTDSSKLLIEALVKENPMVKLVNLEKNSGYGIAVRSGLDAATQDVIGFMDSDGQFKPEDLDLLLPKLQDAKFVAGRRLHRSDSFVRNCFGKVLGGLNVLVFGLYVRDVNCGMKVFKKEIWKTIRPVHGVEKLFCTELFLRLKRNSIPWIVIPVHHYPRLRGTPTGAKVSVIIRMFKELWGLRVKVEKEAA